MNYDLHRRALELRNDMQRQGLNLSGISNACFVIAREIPPVPAKRKYNVLDWIVDGVKFICNPEKYHKLE